jgi:16S rRNA (uracil1498-N3)-methyltransferase
MPRFYIPSDAIHGKRFSLTGSEARHAVLVLRKKVGDSIELFDGKNASFRGCIEMISPEAVSGILVETQSQTTLSVQVTLYQALIKGPRWDWLLEKACEIGVWKVVPIVTQRTLVRLTKADGAAKVTRWKRIALAASKQCGRGDIMEIAPPVPLAAALTHLPTEGLALIPWEKEAAQSIRAACQNFHGSTVAIFIGPEGGWENAEVDQAVRAGALPVRLGPTLLRSETAGLVAATLMMREAHVYA